MSVIQDWISAASLPLLRHLSYKIARDGLDQRKARRPIDAWGSISM